jgi:hypothetical protein
LQQALKHVDISEDAIARLQHPKTSLSLSIPVRMDDGSLKIFSINTVGVQAGCYPAIANLHGFFTALFAKPELHHLLDQFYSRLS